MADKRIPFSKRQLEAIVGRYPTPVHIYDESAIRANARSFLGSFRWAPAGFINYFAVKALPNPHILRLLVEEGMGLDCSSMMELLLAQALGLSGEQIMFSSNDTPGEEFAKAASLGAVINLDDLSHIPLLEQSAGIPELVCCRYNPGALKQGNVIIGNPEEAKFGFTRDQLFEGYATLKAKGARRFGIHTMVASNELDPDYFVETAAILFDLIKELHDQLGIAIELVNLGGGIGIPYRPEQSPVDLGRVAEGVRRSYETKIAQAGLPPIRIAMECGRMVTGPYGYLVTRVRHVKRTYRDFVGLDATMANLMRPGMYKAYHHITIPGKESAPVTHRYDVTGSLCENNDKFAIERMLPDVEPGDFVVIHDAGAHGHAMGFNYNGKLRSAELLLRPDGEVTLIRRAEGSQDYFATLDFPGLPSRSNNS